MWRTDKANCAVDETVPQKQLPRCANASPGVGDKPFWVEAAGDPALLQTPPQQIPAGQGTKPFYLYVAMRPLKLDAQGRVIAMKSWPVRCGPPPPPDPKMAAAQARLDALEKEIAQQQPGQVNAGPGLSSPTDPSSLTPVDAPKSEAPPGPGEPDDVQRAKFKAGMPKLAADSKRLSDSLARMTPTKAPLAGLVMNELGGCAASSPDAVRHAAQASEAWADDDSVSHWVRDRKPGDLPPMSAEPCRR